MHRLPGAPCAPGSASTHLRRGIEALQEADQISAGCITQFRDRALGPNSPRRSAEQLNVLPWPSGAQAPANATRSLKARCGGRPRAPCSRTARRRDFPVGQVLQGRPQEHGAPGGCRVHGLRLSSRLHARSRRTPGDRDGTGGPPSGGPESFARDFDDAAWALRHLPEK